MPKVKTAISIEDNLLAETVSLAQELDIPKSQVVSMALEDFIQCAKAPGNVLLESGEGGLQKASVVNVSQIFTVDKNSLEEYCGSVPAQKLMQVINGIILLIQPAEVD